MVIGAWRNQSKLGEQAQKKKRSEVNSWWMGPQKGRGDSEGEENRQTRQHPQARRVGKGSGIAHIYFLSYLRHYHGNL